MPRAPISSYDQAVAFLLSLVRDDARPYQARARLAQLPVRALLERIGNPHVDLPVVHIAGSKGKGSTALYLEAILSAAGLRTGTFTSPHLERWSERYRVNGRESTAQEFAALFARLHDHVHDLKHERAERAPSFFDVLTAAAFLLFAENQLDCAIIETGIGGRLDATNVVQPLVCCITSVELEHTDKLGNSIAAIAREKAGIIKKGTPVVIGPLPGEAQAVVREHAARLGAALSALDGEIVLRSRRRADGRLSIEVLEEEREYRALLPPMTASSSACNAALAIACAHRVATLRAPRLQEAVTQALAETRPPGRMEVLGEHPWVVIDGAHTPDSTRALADMLKRLPARRIHLVISLTAAKDAAKVLAPLLDGAHRIVCTRADPTRSLDHDKLAASLVANGYDARRVHVNADPRRAVLETHERLAADDLLCVAGSMYMAGVARQTLQANGAVPRQSP